MGCQYCHRNLQIIDEIDGSPPPKSKPILGKLKTLKPKNEFDIDFIKARYLVKILLEEDNLYKTAWNYVKLFNDEQFENLFLGNCEYNKYPDYNINNKRQFKFLLMKFEDFSSILYEWYKDESKYDNLIKIWNSNLNIYLLSKSSDLELEKQLKNIGITDLDNFGMELRIIINNSVESKSSDIKNYLKEKFDDFYSVIEVTEDYKNEFQKTNIKNKKIIIDNLDNISLKLAEKALPLTKDFINEKYPMLNMLSKLKLKSNFNNKLKKLILNEINSDKDKKTQIIGFETVQNLVDNFNKNGGGILKNRIPGLNGVVSVATSYLNLATSIKTYNDNKVKFDEETKVFDSIINEIDNEFEEHVKEIGLLDLENDEPEFLLKKIVEIGKKIVQDKSNVSEVIKCLENKEFLTNIKKKEGIQSAVKNGINLGKDAVNLGVNIVKKNVLNIILYVLANILNLPTFIICLIHLSKLKDQMKYFKETKKKEIEKYEEIENQLEDLRKMYEKAQERYIPKNVLENDSE